MKTLFKVKNNKELSIEILQRSEKQGLNQTELNNMHPKLYRAYLGLKNQGKINQFLVKELMDKGFEVKLGE